MLYSHTFPACIAGAEAPLLSDVSLALPPRSLGLVYGRSGAGKTTLLQLLAGLQQPTSGSIAISAGAQAVLGQGAAQSAAQRLARVGLVFQFPERHFLGDTLQEARAALCGHFAFCVMDGLQAAIEWRGSAASSGPRA